MDTAPHLERRFELGDDEVVALFHVPFQAAGGEFQCDWTVAWPDRVEARYTCGIDAIQALLLAMRLVHTELVESDAYREGRLTYLGESDLGLPPPYSFEAPEQL